MAWSKLYTIAFQERPISSIKFNNEIDNIYEKLNLLKVSSAGINAPTDFEIGQLWFDTLNAVLKLKTASGIRTLAYANNEQNIKSDTSPVFYTLDGTRTMNPDYTPTNALHLTTKSYVDALFSSHTSNTNNPHQTKESQVRNDTSPVFYTLDGTRQMSSEYTPTQARHLTTKSYVDALFSSHTSNTNNPHQTKESQVRDNTSPVFLTLDGSRQMSASYVPTGSKSVATKEYVDNHALNTNNPHQTKESQVRDNTSPVFLTIDGTRQMSPGYTPQNTYDVATKGYVDTMIKTGGVDSIASDYVTYTPSEPTVSIWQDVSNAKEALDLIIETLQSGIVSDTFMVKMSESDTNPDYLLGKVDTNYFEESVDGKLKLKDNLLYKVKMDESDSSPDYLVSKFSSSYFELDELNRLKLLDSLLYKVKMDASDSTPTYLVDKLDTNIFETTLDKKITVKEKGLKLVHLDSGVSIANAFPITNSYGNFYLTSIDTNVFDVYPALTLKDGVITTEKLSANIIAPNSDKVDGYHASTTPSANVIPVTDNTGKIPRDFLPSLDADTVDGYHASSTSGANLIPVSDNNGYFSKWGAINWVEKLQTITNASGNITWNMDNGGVLKLSPMVGNVTLTVTNARYPATYILIAVQDSTGGRTITFPSSFKFQSGETLNTSASKINVISIFYDGTYFYCSITVY